LNDFIKRPEILIMSDKLPLYVPQSPMRIKALEIFLLSKNISQYFVEQMATLDKYGHEHKSIYFTGDIVQQSGSLFPEIINAEEKTFSEDKYRHIASVKQLTHSLYKNCQLLEKSVPHNGKEFLQLLQHELKRFRKLQRIWRLTL